MDCVVLFFFSSRRRHTRWPRDWSSDVCSSDLLSSYLGPRETAFKNCKFVWSVCSAIRLRTRFRGQPGWTDRKSTRLNSSHVAISYAVFCLKQKMDLVYFPAQMTS